jgi:hypothetical protein
LEIIGLLTPALSSLGGREGEKFQIEPLPKLASSQGIENHSMPPVKQIKRQFDGESRQVCYE